MTKKVETVGAPTFVEILQRKLGLRKPWNAESDLVSAIERGFPLQVISSLLRHGIKEDEVYGLILSYRMLRLRKARKQRLSVAESDRAARLARIITLAEQVFADLDAAMHWLRAPKRCFSGRTPMQMLKTDAGSHLIEQMLYQIDEGMAA